MINLKSHFIVVLIIGFVAYQPTVLADNIFSVLEDKTTYVEVVNKLETTDKMSSCDFTFDLFENSNRPVVFFLPAKNEDSNKFISYWAFERMPKQQGSKQLSTLWQLEQLPEFLQESTFENPKVFSGSALNSLLKAHPQFNRNWYFNSSNQTNLKAHLSSLSGYPQTINREVHLILNFSINYQQNEILGGVISSRQFTDFSVYEISQENSQEKINLVTKFINNSGLFSGPLKSVYRFGDNTLLIQWQDENLGIRFERPYAIMLSENDGKLLLYKNVPTISSYAMQSGEYSENLKYISAYDLNGDSLPETQFRYEGRYSASDSFYSFTKEGVFNCGEMILGSD